MDANEVRNRLISTAIGALGAAATTATFLYMFQDSGNVQRLQEVLNSIPSFPSNEQNGPIARGVPKVGDGSMLLPDMIGGLNLLATNARNASSAGLGWFDNFGTPILIVSNAEHSKYILSKTTAHALWGGIQPASEAFFGKSVLFVLEGDEWKRLRYILRDSFKMQRLDRLSTDVTSCAVQLSNRLGEFCNTVVDMNQAFAQYHLASIGKSSFDFDMDVMSQFPKPNQISLAFDYLLNELPRRSFHPDASVREDYVSNTPENVKWQQSSRAVRNVVRETIILRLQEDKHKVARGDLLDAMIASYEKEMKNTSNNVLSDSLSIEAQAELLTDALGDNLVEVFFAGYGTSVVTACVGLYFLAKNKKLMQQAHEEVDRVLNSELKFNAESLHAKMFPFLCRVFNESLRLVPPAPLTARLTTEELVLDGITIPRQTVVWSPVCFYHSDVQAWGGSVSEFDPSRWEKPLSNPASFSPFSGGARDCIGKHFAELETVVAWAVLLKTYDFDVDESFQFVPMFTGFGTRIGNGKEVCMNLIPKKRMDTSSFYSDWTPVKANKGTDEDEDFMIERPKF